MESTSKPANKQKIYYLEIYRKIFNQFLYRRPSKLFPNFQFLIISQNKLVKPTNSQAQFHLHRIICL